MHHNNQTSIIMLRRRITNARNKPVGKSSNMSLLVASVVNHLPSQGQASSIALLIDHTLFSPFYLSIGLYTQSVIAFYSLYLILVNKISSSDIIDPI